jgi:hypothetical protein
MWCEFHRIAVAASPITTNPQTTANRHTSLITQLTQRAWVSTLHGYKAGLRCLMYQETPYTRYLVNAANGYTSDGASGVSEEQAANGNWYARTAGSALITNSIIQLPDNLLDVGVAAVRTAWSTNSRSRVLAGSPATQDFQGVFGDDVNYTLNASGVPATYPTDAQWWVAQQAMYQTIYPDFTGAGLHLVPNLGSWMTGNQATINGILPYTDGALQEFFTVYGYANDAYSGWYHNDLALLENCVASGKRFYAQCHGTATNARYALATLMIGAHSTDSTRQSLGYSGLQDYANEYWITEFDLDIGSPAAAKTEVGGNATGFNGFQRQYSNGWACVNPKYNSNGSTRVAAQIFTLTGGSFTGSGFTNVTSISLLPGEGAVLAAAAQGYPVSAYPGALDTFRVNTSDLTDSKLGTPLTGTVGDHALQHNIIADAVNKLEAELGAVPKGTFSSVRERMGDVTNRRVWEITTGSNTYPLATTMERSDVTALVPQTAITAICSLHGGLVIPAGKTITNIHAFCTAAGSGAVTLFWLALVKLSDRTVIERTTNSTTLPTLNAVHTRALQNPINLSVDTPAYVAWATQVATTSPSFAGMPAGIATMQFQVPILAGNSSTTPTATPPAVAAVLGNPAAGNTQRVYFWLS